MARLRALRNLRTPEAIGELVAALGDENAGVRYFASSTLQWIGGEVVVVMLRGYTKRPPSADAQFEAAKLLAKLEG
jgi:HEAT repeat protein